MMKDHTRFRSYSGDYFWIPNEIYKKETDEYRAALKQRDSDIMENYEAGFTGWIYIPD